MTKRPNLKVLRPKVYSQAKKSGNLMFSYFCIIHVLVGFQKGSSQFTSIFNNFCVERWQHTRRRTSRQFSTALSCKYFCGRWSRWLGECQLKNVAGLNSWSVDHFGGRWPIATARLVTTSDLLTPYIVLCRYKFQILGFRFTQPGEVGPRSHRACLLHYTHASSVIEKGSV